MVGNDEEDCSPLGRPAAGCARTTGHVATNRARREPQTELEPEFSCDALFAPREIGRCHHSEAFERVWRFRRINTLPVIRDDLAVFDRDLRSQQVPVAIERIAVDEHDVSQFARLQRAELIGHLDV